ncbi:MAG: NRAMP family divalent metal transporter [Flavobacteriaceae bacterium]
MKSNLFKSLGPGLLFAGAAIGVSHLVQSTKAGAMYGLGLFWAILLIHLFKYPFFEFGARYTAATKNTLLEGYAKLGKGYLLVYALLNLVNMFTIQAAVTIVTAGIASVLFPDLASIASISIFISIFGGIILVIGRYKTLDQVIKYVVILLSLSTIVALILGFIHKTPSFTTQQVFPTDLVGLTFLITFLGWMPAPLDISIWQSLWTKEKMTYSSKLEIKQIIFDFNIGYVTTFCLGLCFMLLGGLIMYGTGMSFSSKASLFSAQFIHLYTESIGSWAFYIIGIAAFATMLSTTLTTLDASPRSFTQTVQLLIPNTSTKLYYVMLIVLICGTQALILYAGNSMGFLIKIATILSFLTAPFYAFMNMKLINSSHVPKAFHPKKPLFYLAVLGLIFLIGFSCYYIYFINQY